MTPPDSRLGDLSPRAHSLSPAHGDQSRIVVDATAEQGGSSPDAFADAGEVEDSLRTRLFQSGRAECDEESLDADDDLWLEIP
ncbi:MAG: hypothetical protein JWN86_1748 [Planctomycetota bacterium]|nr:hypothetical protein [Planctomycetota bacterium]